MLGLILDTSTERGMIAVCVDDTVIFESQLPFGLQNSHFLLPVLELKMKEHGIGMEDLSYVACGTGPGSYTGIRVGVTAAKGIAFARRLPLVGVSAMEGFLPDRAGPFAVVIDAKMGGVYLQKGVVDGQGKAERGPAMVLPLEEAAELLHEIPLLLTSYAGLLRPKLEAVGGNLSWEWMEGYPAVLPIAKAARKKMEADDFKPDAYLDSHLELHYLRKTQAEIERERNV